MTTLTDLTMSQIATAYSALSGIPTTPKAWNTKAKGIRRIESLMAEKGFTLADVLIAAGINPETTDDDPAAETLADEEPVDDTLERDVAAAEASFAGAPPGEEPVPDVAAILTSDKVFSDVFGLVGQYLIKTHGLDEMTAANAAQRAVFALAPPALPAHRAGPSSRSGTKQEVMIDLLRRPEGATIPELARTLGWAEHSVRGAIAAALEKRMGLTVVSEKGTNGARTYRIPAAA